MRKTDVTSLSYDQASEIGPDSAFRFGFHIDRSSDRDRVRAPERARRRRSAHFNLYPLDRINPADIVEQVAHVDHKRRSNFANASNAYVAHFHAHRTQGVLDTSADLGLDPVWTFLVSTQWNIFHTFLVQPVLHGILLKQTTYRFADVGRVGIQFLTRIILAVEQDTNRLAVMHV